MSCVPIEISYQGSQLGQVNPANTLPVSIYSPGTGPAIIKHIFITNVTSDATTFRIFLDQDGESYTTSTALFYGAFIDANTTILLDVYLSMNFPGGNLAAQSGTADALTFTVFGGES